MSTTPNPTPLYGPDNPDPNPLELPDDAPEAALPGDMEYEQDQIPAWSGDDGTGMHPTATTYTTRTVGVSATGYPTEYATPTAATYHAAPSSGTVAVFNVQVNEYHIAFVEGNRVWSDYSHNVDYSRNGWYASQGKESPWIPGFAPHYSYDYMSELTGNHYQAIVPMMVFCDNSSGNTEYYFFVEVFNDFQAYYGYDNFDYALDGMPTVTWPGMLKTARSPNGKNQRPIERDKYEKWFASTFGTKAYMAPYVYSMRSVSTAAGRPMRFATTATARIVRRDDPVPQATDDTVPEGIDTDEDQMDASPVSDEVAALQAAAVARAVAAQQAADATAQTQAVNAALASGAISQQQAVAAQSAADASAQASALAVQAATDLAAQTKAVNAALASGAISQQQALAAQAATYSAAQATAVAQQASADATAQAQAVAAAQAAGQSSQQQAVAAQAAADAAAQSTALAAQSAADAAAQSKAVASAVAAQAATDSTQQAAAVAAQAASDAAAQKAAVAAAVAQQSAADATALSNAVAAQQSKDATTQATAVAKAYTGLPQASLLNALPVFQNNVAVTVSSTAAWSDNVTTPYSLDYAHVWLQAFSGFDVNAYSQIGSGQNTLAAAQVSPGAVILYNTSSYCNMNYITTYVVHSGSSIYSGWLRAGSSTQMCGWIVYSTTGVYLVCTSYGFTSQSPRGGPNSSPSYTLTTSNTQSEILSLMSSKNMGTTNYPGARGFIYDASVGNYGQVTWLSQI